MRSYLTCEKENEKGALAVLDVTTGNTFEVSLCVVKWGSKDAVGRVELMCALLSLHRRQLVEVVQPQCRTSSDRWVAVQRDKAAVGSP